MKSIQIPSPKEGHVWAYGSYNGAPVKIKVNSKGRLEIERFEASEDVDFYREIIGTETASAGTNTFDTTAVATGKLRVIQSVVARDETTIANKVKIQLISNEVAYALAQIIPTKIDETLEFYAIITLKPGEKLRFIVEGASLNDHIHADFTGYEQ